MRTATIKYGNSETEITVKGEYIPLEPATRESPEEGGYIDDPEIYIADFEVTDLLDNDVRKDILAYAFDEMSIQ